MQRSICILEEALQVELEKNIIQDLKNYNPKTLLDAKPAPMKNEPLALVPFKEAKNRVDKKTKTVQQALKKKSSGIRHSFYPNWSHGVDKVKEFASSCGFKEIAIEPSDHYTTLSALWRQRELVVNCDRIGMINEIRHRSARWLSATFKSFDEKGDDIRCYLETRAPLDEDESCLETVVEFLKGRSVFTETFLKQIEKLEGDEEDGEHEPLSTKPLIAEMFHLNWHFRSMRRITTVHKFINKDKDLIVFNQIYDGVFRHETHTFEWFPKHYEFEIKMCVDNHDKRDLGVKSYEMSLKLLDLTKRN